jgi:hypothetical protein
MIESSREKRGVVGHNHDEDDHSHGTDATKFMWRFAKKRAERRNGDSNRHQSAVASVGLGIHRVGKAYEKW